MKNKKVKSKEVTKPVFELNVGPGHAIRLWALEAGEYAKLSGARCHEFYAGKTASLIYEQFGSAVGLHSATEYSLRDEGTWQWLQKFAEDKILLARALECVLETIRKHRWQVNSDEPDTIAVARRVLSQAER